MQEFQIGEIGEAGEPSREKVFQNILGQMDLNIYITDPETDQILYMNETMKRTFGLESPEGKICWQVLQDGQCERCSFCPICALESGASGIHWEEHNSLTGRTYQNYDRMIDWAEGKKAHFQQSLDITEIKALTKAVNVDELTGVFSRRAGKAMLQAAIQDCKLQNKPLAVCMYDVNDLKKVNDLYGHKAGDTLLSMVASAVRGALGTNDFLFRLSGDEFIAVFIGAGEEEVSACFQAVLRRLGEKKLFPGLSRPEEFCFGIAPMPVGKDASVEELLSAADEKLYVQKRLWHILRAGQEQTSSVCLPMEFHFDKERLYSALVQSTDDYIYVCNMKTGVFRYPQAMVEEFNLPGEVIANAASVWGERVHEEDRMAFLESNQEITDGRTDCHSVEYRALNRRGEWVWLRCRGHLERDEDGAPSLFAGFITNLGRKNRVDPVTGLLNRFELENELEKLVERDHPFALLLFDVDGFMRVNSLYDRAFGDEVLRMIGTKLQSFLPPNASAYRLEGDEFAVVLREGTSDEASGFYHSIQTAFAHQQEYLSRKFSCTLSAGCAFFLEKGQTAGEIIKKAGHALECAKLKGRNQLVFFSAAAMESATRSLELIELLRESVENGFEGFTVHYQPIFNGGRELDGAEALMRWSCGKYGNVSPEEFIGLLEESGLIMEAGRWVFKQAAAKCADFLREKTSFTMGINLSCLQLDDLGLLDFMLLTLKEAGVKPEHIMLELTESYLAANMERLNTLLYSFRAAGMRVAMDDFGTGYSSLSILKQAPIDIVKVDRAFVKGIAKSDFDYSLIRLVVELCKTVGIKVCLEGVETETEYGTTKPLGVNLLQGFLLGKPMPPERFEENFLKEK